TLQLGRHRGRQCLHLHLPDAGDLQVLLHPSRGGRHVGHRGRRACVLTKDSQRRLRFGSWSAVSPKLGRQLTGPAPGPLRPIALLALCNSISPAVEVRRRSEEDDSDNEGKYYPPVLIAPRLYLDQREDSWMEG